MAGYIGTKAALLSTTTASVGGDSTVGGDLTVDTNTLHVDSANNRVGIGNTSPTQALDVTGDIITSGGVYLGGVGSSNKLDDYEEGTWTPSLSFSSGSIGYAWNLGQYTKVGNQVSVNFAISINSISSPSGAISMTGFPFAAGSGEQYVSAITFGIIRSLTADEKTVRGYVGSAQTFAPLTLNATNAGYNGLSASYLTASTFLYGSVVYQTS